MRTSQIDQFIEERVIILTDGERIEGSLFHMGGVRLSDFLTSPIHQDSRFLKLKDPTVYCRRSGEELVKVPFAMVARDRIVMVMTHVAVPQDEPGSLAAAGRQFRR